MLWLQSSFHPSLPNRAQPLTSWVGPKKLPNCFFAKLFGPNPKSVKPNSNKNNETRNQTRDAMIKSKPFLVFDWIHHHAWDLFGLLVLSPCGALGLFPPKYPTLETRSSKKSCHHQIKTAWPRSHHHAWDFWALLPPTDLMPRTHRESESAESLVGVTSSSR